MRIGFDRGQTRQLIETRIGAQAARDLDDDADDVLSPGGDGSRRPGRVRVSEYRAFTREASFRYPSWRGLRPVRVWDTASGQQRHLLTGHRAYVYAVAIGPDGTWLATASGDKMVLVWDATTRQQRHQLIGHDGWCAWWRSPRTAPGSPAGATTGQCGSGTSRPGSNATDSPATTGLCGRLRSSRTGTLARHGER